MVFERLKGKKKTQFYFFSGKGGVGKTSMSAATALYFAKKGKKVLIISTDPAHSLSDSFEEKIGGEIKKLRKNLFAVEIDPKKAMQEYKEKIMGHIEKVDYLKDLGLEETFGVADMSPGIDEVAAFDKFLQYMHSGDYDVIIFDTAPTGHALRFLSLPDVLDSWVGKIISIRMKLAGLASMIKKFLPFTKDDEQPSIGTEQLEAMKKRIEDAKKILTDKNKTHFWIVTIPEQMSIYESERARKMLESYGINVTGVIVNQLIPKNKCEFCQARREMQQKNLKLIHEKFSDVKIKEIPLFKHEVKGYDKLEIIGKMLFEK